MFRVVNGFPFFTKNFEAFDECRINIRMHGEFIPSYENFVLDRAPETVNF